MKIKDEYNKVKDKTKAVSSNKTYSSNIMLAIASIFVLLVFSGTFAFRGDAFLTLKWWLFRVYESVSMVMLMVSMAQIHYEKQRAIKAFSDSVKTLAGKIFCCNDNDDKGTYDGVMHEVNLFNKRLCEKKWLKKLRRTIGSFFATDELSKLNKDFDTFFKLKGDWWDEYFNKKEEGIYFIRKIFPRTRLLLSVFMFKIKRRRIKRVVRKIQNNEYRIKGLITMDAILYDTSNNSDTVSPAYNARKTITAGAANRIISLFSMAAIFASIFLDQAPNVGGWIWNVVTRFFMIASTLFMAYSLGQKMSDKRRNAVHKRLAMLEAAFNFCGLPDTIRAKYYDMSHKIESGGGTV